jgi:hypothetical protein
MTKKEVLFSFIRFNRLSGSMNSTSVAAENFDKFVRAMLKIIKCT